MKFRSGRTMLNKTIAVLLIAFLATGSSLTSKVKSSVVDKRMIRLLSSKRCGVENEVKPSPLLRPKRYALQSKWTVKALTYRISKYPKELHKFDVDREVAKAFALWSQHTDLTFSPKFSGIVDIDIRFVDFEHGDGAAFDGPGTVLAHAHYPVFGGYIHFDNNEIWTINSSQGINLLQVAAHQIGHSLGLGHSKVGRAVMYPLYRGYDPKLKLDFDDIHGIQALYGKKSPEELVSASKVHLASFSTFCDISTIDAIFKTADGAVYAFQGNSYYRISNKTIAAGYPKSISEGWPGLPDHIDAVFTYKNGKTYFFRGSKYWRYNGRTVEGDYPKRISGGFAGIPNNIDAAMVWGKRSHIYFFKGSRFWLFDPFKRPPVESKYPKPISFWKGIPGKIDAAFQGADGFTYFFKGENYFKFNDTTFSVFRRLTKASLSFHKLILGLIV